MKWIWLIPTLMIVGLVGVRDPGGGITNDSDGVRDPGGGCVLRVVRVSHGPRGVVDPRVDGTRLEWRRSDGSWGSVR